MNWTDEQPQEIRLHDWTIRPKIKSKSATPCYQPPKAKVRRQEKSPAISWTVRDIAKAGRLLTSPPLQTDFEDEQEMRRVYTLIYDVFRFKNPLNQVLNDVLFFQMYPEFDKTTPHVWLLFYDLYHRGFKNRESSVMAIAQNLLEDSGLTPVEDALWKIRTKLAASISRLRIENNALTLSDLLPANLKNEKITTQSMQAPVTCWVNTKKVKTTDELRKQLESKLNVKLVEETHELRPNEYKWDKHCPQIIAFHGSMRSKLAKSDLVKNYKLIVQDKSFCLGPAAFVKVITELDLTGSVIQTHVNSPRTTAYLATILSQNVKIKKLMAFSAGTRKSEYEAYFNHLGMTNVVIFSDRLTDISPTASYMEEVVAVFASPPNSYSAVADPIDLVCSRGGDLSMLEILTESEETREGKERTSSILEEQRKTLRFAMSRPQIQLVVYETHSELEAENDGMVQKTVKEINKLAKMHHATLQGKLTSGHGEDAEINNNSELANDEKLEDVTVPDTDIFHTPNLPNLCPNRCLNFTKEGCFLALLQRKQVIRLDNKYMIQMAEQRGLFGRTSSSSSRPKQRASRKKQDKPPSPLLKTKRRIKETEIIRIAAPTQSFLQHANVHECKKCPRCHCEEEEQKEPIYKQWWSETTRHIMALRSNLVKNKLIPAKSKTLDTKSVVDAFVVKNYQIDEIVANSRGADNSKIPIFPRLKLKREDQKIEKVQLRLPITMVQFF